MPKIKINNGWKNLEAVIPRVFVHKADSAINGVNAKIVNGCSNQRLFYQTSGRQYPQKVLLDCVVEDSESAKQKTKEWQPGSDQGQLGINHHDYWWRCQS